MGGSVVDVVSFVASYFGADGFIDEMNDEVRFVCCPARLMGAFVARRARKVFWARGLFEIVKVVGGYCVGPADQRPAGSWCLGEMG